MSPPLAAAEQAEHLRLDGNTYFKICRFGAAIDAYTEAITLCPNIPVYWTNRALCHRKRNEWTRVEEDCRKAIQLDHHSVKGDNLFRCFLPSQALIFDFMSHFGKHVRTMVSPSLCMDYATLPRHSYNL
ncbi:hypothetical protein RD792_018043 [Penstemon davidsonii]|uniref:RING-type E3 ubiquitin transferase n=1 Tax=Penstemon davidsonii TaxID=160366 RepID=A0ABR0DV71_9LAMI|nr:hypothetical protein RD792_018043 [Penstemon davidsonii]